MIKFFLLFFLIKSSFLFSMEEKNKSKILSPVVSFDSLKKHITEWEFLSYSRNQFILLANPDGPFDYFLLSLIASFDKKNIFEQLEQAKFNYNVVDYKNQNILIKLITDWDDRNIRTQKKNLIYMNLCIEKGADITNKFTQTNVPFVAYAKNVLKAEEYNQLAYKALKYCINENLIDRLRVIAHSKCLTGESVTAIFNYQNQKCDTLLHEIIKHANSLIYKSIACCLTAYSIDHAILNKQNKRGNTPLHIAIERKKQWIIYWLLSQGASLAVENDAHLTPFDLFIQHLCKSKKSLTI